MIGLSYGKYGGGWREITRKQVYTLISVTSDHLIILIIINLTFYIINYQKLRETCPNTELFLVCIFPRKYSYSVPILENTDQK